MKHYGIHIICTCNSESLLYQINLFKDVDAILPIEPPTKSELLIILQEKIKNLGLKLPENTIEYIVELQYRFGIYHRRFGFDIYHYICNLSVTKEINFWTCVNIIIDYATQTLDSMSSVYNRRLKEALRESEFKEILLDNLCSYFRNKQVYFISWDIFNELYENTLSAIDSLSTDNNFNDSLQFLEEIGFLYSPVEDPKEKKYKSIYELNPPNFFLGWNQDTIELVQTNFLGRISRNCKKSKNLEIIDKKDKGKKTFRKNEEVMDKEPLNILNYINEKRIISISEDNGRPVDEIYQKGKQFKKEYDNIITEEVALYLVAKNYEKNAPVCKHIKKDGMRCRNTTRDLSGFCHHHR